MNGTYNIIMQTPMGNEKGILSLKTEEGNKLTGMVDIMNTQKSINGKYKDNTFEFFGEVKKMFVKITFKVVGKVDGNKLEAIAHSNLGDFKITGAKQ